MEPADAVKRLLPAFEQYYTIKKEDILPPFCAEAEFHSHNEQYLLVRSAHIADIDSNEFVYFATTNELTDGTLGELVNAAWNTGLAKVHPYSGHRNSDISLFVFTKSVSKETIQKIRKTKLYKSYKFSLYGWSHFKLAVVDLDSKSVYYNRFGKEHLNLLKKNIFGGNSK